MKIDNNFVSRGIIMLVLAVALVGIFSLSFDAGWNNDISGYATAAQRCGDGTCQTKEKNKGTCPQDCGDTAATVQTRAAASNEQANKGTRVRAETQTSTSENKVSTAAENIASSETTVSSASTNSETTASSTTSCNSGYVYLARMSSCLADTDSNSVADLEQQCLHITGDTNCSSGWTCSSAGMCEKE